MARLHNRKVVMGNRDDYTDEEYARIPIARHNLKVAEANVREANGLWRDIVQAKYAITPLRGHRVVQETRHLRYIAHRNLRTAYGAYVTAVMQPPNLKMIAREMGAHLRARLSAPSFMSQILPPTVVTETEK